MCEFDCGYRRAQCSLACPVRGALASSVQARSDCGMPLAPPPFLPFRCAGNGLWLDKAQRACLILWKTIPEWAGAIYTWARSLGAWARVLVRRAALYLTLLLRVCARGRSSSRLVCDGFFFPHKQLCPMRSPFLLASNQRAWWRRGPHSFRCWPQGGGRVGLTIKPLVVASTGLVESELTLEELAHG